MQHYFCILITHDGKEYGVEMKRDGIYFHDNDVMQVMRTGSFGLEIADANPRTWIPLYIFPNFITTQNSIPETQISNGLLNTRLDAKFQYDNGYSRANVDVYPVTLPIMISKTVSDLKLVLVPNEGISFYTFGSLYF